MIALYPIKPVYTDRILAGEKMYELRKRLPREEIAYVLIYATYPVGKVVGYAGVKSFHKRSVSELWDQVKSRAGINEQGYMDYFGSAEQACAIEFDSVYKFVRPFSVTEIKPNLTVPQSFCYVDAIDFRRLRKRKVIPV